jgi:hypothetical protein
LLPKHERILQNNNVDGDKDETVYVGVDSSVALRSFALFYWRVGGSSLEQIGRLITFSRRTDQNIHIKSVFCSLSLLNLSLLPSHL